MTPTETATILRRYSRKIGQPAGDVPSVMLAAAEEIEQLAAKLEAAEKEVESIRQEIAFRDDVVAALAAACDALRAKIAEMERQEPAWFIDERGEPKRYHKSKADYCKYGGLDLLYALPGAVRPDLARGES